MNKKELLEGHNKEEQILISKMMDKMEEAKQKKQNNKYRFLRWISNKNMYRNFK